MCSWDQRIPLTALHQRIQNLLVCVIPHLLNILLANFMQKKSMPLICSSYLARLVQQMKTTDLEPVSLHSYAPPPQDATPAPAPVPISHHTHTAFAADTTFSTDTSLQLSTM